MFSTRSQLLGIGLQVAKNLNRPFISKTPGTRKAVFSYFSIKANVAGEVIPPIEREKSPRPGAPKEGVDGDLFKSKNEWSIKKNNQDDTSHSLLYMLKAITKSSVRNTADVNSICKKLVDSSPVLNVKESIELLYYLSVLNIHDEKLLTKNLKVLNDQLSEIYKASPFITSVTKSLRNLQMRDTEVLNGLIQWFLNKTDNFEVSEAGDLILTLAVLNYFPAHADVLLTKILNYNIRDYANSTDYLNFVWALTISDRVTPELAESVLVPSYRKRLESISVPIIRYSIYLKLINIHAHSSSRKFKIEMDSNWYNSENTLLRNVKDKRLKDTTVRNFIDCLANFMPVRTFNTFVETKSGYVIDAICFFDSDHKPVTELESVKRKNGIKLAIMFLFYKNLCLPGKNIPNGIIEFQKRFLESSNYKVLYIPYNEFQNNGNLRMKTNYLKGKIQSVLPRFDKHNEQ